MYMFSTHFGVDSNPHDCVHHIPLNGKAVMDQKERTCSQQNIAAVVVTYNRKNLLEACITHILNQRGISCDVLVVDNASTDGTAELVQSIPDSRVRYRNTGANLGGAGGFHFGLQWAVNAGYDYAWIMDDDCLPNEDALITFWDADRKLNGTYGWLSSQVLWTDGDICRMNIQRVTPFKKVSDFSSELSPAVAASFVSLFLPASCVRTYGLPIKDFFIWADDLEYTRRISRKERCYVVPGSKVVHAMTVNTDSNIVYATQERMNRYSYSYRNEVYLYRREGLPGWLWILAKYSRHSLQVLTSSTDKKWSRIRVIWKGFFRGLRFHPEVEYVEALSTQNCGE